MTQHTSKGTVVVTGGSNGIGKEILTCLESKYDKAFSYDVTAAAEQDIRDLEQLATFFSTVLTPEKQNDLVVSAGVFRPINFIDQKRRNRFCFGYPFKRSIVHNTTIS